jgi:hypothetical protein
MSNHLLQPIMLDVVKVTADVRLEQVSNLLRDEDPRSARRALWGLRPGRNPYEHSRKSASNTTPENDSNEILTPYMNVEPSLSDCGRKKSAIARNDGILRHCRLRIPHSLRVLP